MSDIAEVKEAFKVKDTLDILLLCSGIKLVDTFLKKICPATLGGRLGG